jgi:hypothetical protein
VALLPKHLHTPRGIKLILVVINGVDKDRHLKCDVHTLAIIQRFIYDHLLNGPSILPQSESFRFGWMNCDPFDAALIGGSQGHRLNVEKYSLRRRRIPLLCLCRKRLVLLNGSVILNEILLNCSLATFLFLPLIRHFHLVVEMDQAATLQHQFRRCALLPMYTTFLRLLRPILHYVENLSTLFWKAANSSLFIGTVWSFLYLSRTGYVVQRVLKLVLHPFGVAKLPFVLIPLVSRNGIFKKPPHMAQKRLFSNSLLQSQKISVYICERRFLEPLV